jgi:hypothetical protein
MRIKRSNAQIKLDEATNQQVGKLVNEIKQRYLADITQRLRKEIVKLIDAEWRALATKKLTGSRAKYLARYLQGIEPVVLKGDSIILSLGTADAAKIEAGWAPPQSNGSTINDGIGTYDGTPKDLRPLLLYSGKPANVATTWQSESRHWKVIKFDLGNSQSAIETVVTDWMKQKFETDNEGNLAGEFAQKADKAFKLGLAKAVKAAKASRDRVRRRTGVSDGRANLEKKAIARLGNTKTILWSETLQKSEEIQHRQHIFANMRVRAAGRKVSFATFRTISDSPKQRNRWRAVGIPPANIISGDPNGDDLVRRIATILVDKGFRNVLRSNTNLIPKYSRAAPINLGTVTEGPSRSTSAPVSAPIASTTPTFAAKSSTSAAPAAVDPVVASMAARSQTQSPAPAVVTPPAAQVVQASPTKEMSYDSRVEAKARELIARDFPKNPEQKWEQYRSMYLENAKAIVNKERYVFKDKVGDNAEIEKANMVADALNESRRGKSANWSGS